MAELPIGTQLKTDKGQSLHVIEELGRGGQGIVYRVEVEGAQKALKWYHEGEIKDPMKFYENLCNNIKIGSPADCFLWPQDSVRSKEYRSFGYIMDLRPEGYIGMPRFLLKQRFSSTRARIDAMINMVNGFRILHNQGFCYQDLNDGNFFINPVNGDVLICDNDNVAYSGYSNGIIGKSRYMAPEIVLGQKMPDKASDRHSLALLLFELICMAHPLEGSGANPPCMKPSYERHIYGSSPVFIFDPEDDSNRPIRGVHPNPIKRWPELPGYVKGAFIRTFSKAAMTYDKNTNTYAAPRVIEKEWLDVLIRLRNSIATCSCGNDEYVEDGKLTCSKCGKRLPVACWIQTLHYQIPVCPGARVLRMELENCADDVAIAPVAEVLEAPEMPGDPAGFAIKNISGMTWSCITSKGAQRQLLPERVMPAKPGIRVNIGKMQFETK